MPSPARRADGVGGCGAMLVWSCLCWCAGVLVYRCVAVKPCWWVLRPVVLSVGGCAAMLLVCHRDRNADGCAAVLVGVWVSRRVAVLSWFVGRWFGGCAAVPGCRRISEWATNTTGVPLCGCAGVPP